ncbi:hypothetical protein DM860_015610 [Cuscuta australis]|uniref:Cell wall hydroxyproline-rich glycoprotein n=1 Tax=Cuscuta australis TaxID=267555 RepID=A0A328DG26_9ASTE|nr:hypothetical protein DM860_015610 [Cuscuta australis]
MVISMNEMNSCSIILFSILFLRFCAPTSSSDYSNAVAGAGNQRRPLSYNGDALAVDPSLSFGNRRLENAYIALQAWKEAIISDPLNITGNWVGSGVCHYTGVFCWQAPDDPSETTVSGIDINHGDLAGTLPHELGLLYDISLFHINSNRFCGTIPWSFVDLKLLFELDLSNNRFAGSFPGPLLRMPSLKYLDIRFNEFEGRLPDELFERAFDAIFINNNRFSGELPRNVGNSPASVIVLANNAFRGCLPQSLGNMSRTLSEMVLSNNAFRSCLPGEIGGLEKLNVLDLSRNEMMGALPESMGQMRSLKELNLGHNMFSGEIPDGICSLGGLVSFGYEHNYFTSDAPACLNLPSYDDRENCLRDRDEQRPELECKRLLSAGVNCSSFKCGPDVPPCSPPGFSSPPPQAKSPPPPPAKPPQAKSPPPPPPSSPQPSPPAKPPKANSHPPPPPPQPPIPPATPKSLRLQFNSISSFPKLATTSHLVFSPRPHLTLQRHRAQNKRRRHQL